MAATKSSYQATDAQAAYPASTQLEGSFDGKGLRLAVVVSRYNGELTGKLLSGILETATHHGVAEEDLAVAYVPGAYEISSAAALLAARGTFDAIIGIGVVIQGETDHARLINEQISQALADLSRKHGIPVLDGIVPAGTIEHAEVRCQVGMDGRGGYLAKAAIEMARLFEKIKGL